MSATRFTGIRVRLKTGVPRTISGLLTAKVRKDQLHRPNELLPKSGFLDGVRIPSPGSRNVMGILPTDRFARPPGDVIPNTEPRSYPRVRPPPRTPMRLLRVTGFAQRAALRLHQISARQVSHPFSTRYLPSRQVTRAQVDSRQSMDVFDCCLRPKPQ